MHRWFSTIEGRSSRSRPEGGGDLAAARPRSGPSARTKGVAVAVGAVLVVALVALSSAGAHPGASSATATTQAPRTVGSDGTTTSLPAISLPVVPSIVHDAPTTTTAPPQRSAVPATTTTTAAPGPCTSQDLSFQTTTDAAGYAPGATVTVTTTVRDLVACQFTPTAAADGSCPAEIVVLDASGGQVYPPSRQAEKCASLPGGLLQPGSEDEVSLRWAQQVTTAGGSSAQAPGGSYSAVGTWTWSEGGQVTSSGPTSAPFTIS